MGYWDFDDPGGRGHALLSRRHRARTRASNGYSLSQNFLSAFPAVALFFALASITDRAFPRRVTVAWLMLTVVLIAYVGMLGWGPTLETTRGLAIQVVAQKTVAIVALLVIGYVTYEGDRVLAHAGQSYR
jgi:hypothetical protein